MFGIKQGLVIVLVLGLSSIGLTFEAAARERASRPVPKNHYLFIETWTHSETEVLEGSYIGGIIDGPGYLYNRPFEAEQTLFLSKGWSHENWREYFRLSANPLFLAIWGNGFSLRCKPVMCGGIFSGFTGIYRLPFQAPSSTWTPFELLSIESNGTAVVRFRGELLTLRAGESWQVETEPEIKREYGNALIKESFTYRITNFGFWPKRKLNLGHQGWSKILWMTRVTREIEPNIINLTVFDLRGRAVLSCGGGCYEVELQAEWQSKLPLANGVYLYVITYRKDDGTILKSEVKKLVILR